MNSIPKLFDFYKPPKRTNHFLRDSIVRCKFFAYNFVRKGKIVLMEQERKSVPRTQNYVVARYRDGRMIKGITYDFGPQKKGFHVVELEGDEGKQGGKVHEVLFSELKAVFFVKSLEGRKSLPSLKGLLEEEEEESPGFLKVKITFFDGETLVGTTYGFNPEREGFFVIPMERDSNNLRIFVISSAIKNIQTRR